MNKLKKDVTFETAFEFYEVNSIIGEGGAGVVYSGASSSGSLIALKLLKEVQATTEKRSRFQNEIGFLLRNTHPNIVKVLDHGVSRVGSLLGPFYVMPKFDCSLRELIQNGIPEHQVMPLFSQILDGVEAAHLKKVVHRDLKPENILHKHDSNTIAIADFGIARFTEETLVANVKTKLESKLANFQYAAPEQRTKGSQVDKRADLYALGLILNEMFTKVVPHGTDYRSISSVSAEFAYLDDIVSRLLRQNPDDRPASVDEVKGLIQRYHSEAVSRQRISQIDATVIPAQTVDAPLAHTPPKLISIDWDNSTLTLMLDTAVSPEWVDALRNMPGYTSVMGKGPDRFSIRGDKATIGAQEHEVQPIIDHFKNWLPVASRTLKNRLEHDAQQREATEKEQLKRHREAEERRLKVLSTIKL